MSDWAPVEQAAKDANGNFQVLMGGQWKPASQVAKNPQGQFVAMLDDGAPAPNPRAAEVPSAVAPAPPPAPRQSPFLSKVLGSVEAALHVAGQVGGMVGMAGGFAGGVAGALATGQYGTPQGADAIERTASESAQRGQGAVEGGLRRLVGLPGNAPVSQPGQEMAGAVDSAMSQLPAMAAGPRGMVGMSGNQPSGVRPALHAVSDVAAAATDKATPTLSPSNLARAGTAVDAGIPISPHQLSGNKFLQLLGEAAENVPFAGGSSLRKARRENFSAGLAKAIDPATDARVLDDATFKGLQDVAGGKIGEIAGRTDVPIQSFGDVLDLARRDTPDVQGVIATYAADLKKIADENGGVVPGAVLRKFRTEAITQERGARANKGDLANALDRFTKRLDDALSEHAPEGDMAALAEARRQYAISKTLEPLVSAFPNGDFPPARLKAIVTNNAQGKRRMARGEAGELGEYARLGQDLLKDVVTSNTTERHIVYGGVGAAATGGLAGINPVAAGALYAGSALYNLLGPRVVKRLVEAQRKREAPAPAEVPAEPTLGQGFENVPQGRPAPAAGPLGDLTPDWQTAPGAAERPRVEVVPQEGLVPAVGEEAPLPQGVPQRPGSQIPLQQDRPLGDLTPDWQTAQGAAEPAARAEVVPQEGLVPAVGETQPSRVQPAGSAQPTGTSLRGAGQEIPAVPGRPDLPDTMVAGRPQEVAGTQATGEAMQAPDAALARRQQMGEVERIRAKTDNPEVAKVLDEHAATLERKAKADALKARNLKAAGELRRMAGLAKDADLAKALRKRADALEGAEKIPVGKTEEGLPAEKPEKPTKPVPAGEAKELPVERVEPENPDIPAGEATEIQPEGVVDGKRLESSAVQQETGTQGVQVDAAAGGKAQGQKTQTKSGPPQVGGMYVDKKGRRAIYQADGTWKVVK